MEQKKVKKGTPPPRYDEEFKAGAVRLVTEQGGAAHGSRERTGDMYRQAAKLAESIRDSKG